jgi:hypothetical protein
MRTLIGSLLIGFVFVASALAELRDRTPKELSEGSTNIVTGRVLAIYARDVETELYGKGTVETMSVVEIEVEGVEKGDGIKDKDVIYVRCWQLKKRGALKKRPGPVGHDIPKEGDKVRAYIVRGGMSPTQKKDSGFAALEPNGFVALPIRK